jgi:hypothetical protein
VVAGNPFGSLRFLSFKYGKARKDFESGLLWEDFCNWILEVEPELAGYQIMAKISCEDPPSLLPLRQE